MVGTGSFVEVTEGKWQVGSKRFGKFVTVGDRVRVVSVTSDSTKFYVTDHMSNGYVPVTCVREVRSRGEES